MLLLRCGLSSSSDLLLPVAPGFRAVAWPVAPFLSSVLSSRAPRATRHLGRWFYSQCLSPHPLAVLRNTHCAAIAPSRPCRAAARCAGILREPTAREPLCTQQLSAHRSAITGTGKPPASWPQIKKTRSAGMLDRLAHFPRPARWHGGERGRKGKESMRMSFFGRHHPLGASSHPSDGGRLVRVVCSTPYLKFSLSPFCIYLFFVFISFFLALATNRSPGSSKSARRNKGQGKEK